MLNYFHSTCLELIKLRKDNKLTTVRNACLKLFSKSWLSKVYSVGHRWTMACKINTEAFDLDTSETIQYREFYN